MKLSKLRELLDAIAKEHGEDVNVKMFYDNSHGGGSWECADVENVVEFDGHKTFYLGADFDYMGMDPYDKRCKAKYTAVNDAIKGNWSNDLISPYCDDDEEDEL